MGLDKKVEYLIVDTSAFIKNAALQVIFLALSKYNVTNKNLKIRNDNH